MQEMGQLWNIVLAKWDQIGKKQMWESIKNVGMYRLPHLFSVNLMIWSHLGRTMSQSWPPSACHYNLEVIVAYKNMSTLGQTNDSFDKKQMWESKFLYRLPQLVFVHLISFTSSQNFAICLPHFCMQLLPFYSFNFFWYMYDASF